MMAATKLLGRVLVRDLPPRILGYALMGRVLRFFSAGSNRFDLERLYAETSDPWHYRISGYEHRKYQRTLDTILQFRNSSDSALELACSIGMFSKQLGRHFRKVVAVDFAAEAVAQAAQYCRDDRNISFVRANLVSLEIAGDFDVIIAAEVLNYVAQRHAAAVCERLGRYLRHDGIIVLVGGAAESDFWENLLSEKFSAVLQDAVDDDHRPYRIAVFRRAR